MNLLEMGNFFTNYREIRGFTQQDAASIIGVCEKTIKNLESGRTHTDFHTILSLCDLYNIPLSKIWQFYIRDSNMEYALTLYHHSEKGKRRKKDLVLTDNTL